MWNARRAVGASLLLALPLTGCGGDGDGPESSPKATAPAPVSQANVTPQGLPEIPTVHGAAGARADVKPGRCSTDPGDVKVAGTVRNPTEKATDYAITVSWITARSDVRDRAVATVRDLGGGRSARWAVRTTLEPDNATRCTFFVQRGRLAG